MTAATAWRRLQSVRGFRRHVLAIAASAVGVAVVTAVIELLKGHAPVISLGVLYVFVVLASAITFGALYSVLVSVASMLTFNFFFIPPTRTFTIADSRNWYALAVYLGTAVVVSNLAARSRLRAAEAEQRASETAVIAELATSLLGGTKITDELTGLAERSAGVLDASSVTIELGPPHPPPAGQLPLPLLAGDRHIGTLYHDDRAAPSLAVRRRFLPALTSLLAVAVDRERLAEQALEAEALRRSDTTKTAVLRAVSHDFRTPLTSIRMAVDGLSNKDLTLTEDDRRDLVDTIRLETDRLIRLVANLLDLSRLQAGAAEPVQELWTVESLVYQALTGLGDRADRVRTDLPADLPLVRMDPSHSQRILVNLLENALRHSPPDEPVTVRGSRTRQEVIIRVIDHGPGIRSADLERVFEPFWAGATNSSGAGLGLAIARGFAEANGGRLWAESQSRQGASLVLALPVGQSPRDSRAANSGGGR